LLVLPAQGTPLLGTKSVGPTGNYASLTAAIADVQAVGNGLGGALVLELQATYVSTVETFPLTIPALNGASAVNTLTIRPASGATALSISSADTTAATVNLNGAQFVTIDGRPGGAGSNAGSGGGAASQLTIANTSTSGVALRFINEASGNTIRYTTLRGVNTSSSSGTVVFSTTTGANGNDNNTMDHCDLGDGASTPANGLYAFGSTSTAAQYNSGNIVSNCNVFNFSAAPAIDAAGVRFENGTTDWTLTGNSFYQTASRAAVAANVRAIYINTTFGNNFSVAGNFIGGSTPNAGGTAWTTTGTTLACLFQGIQLNVGNFTPSSVQGNVIANFVWTSSSAATALPGVWSGIYVQAGSVNVGTVTGNTIGSGSGTDSVSVTTSGNGGTSFGIDSMSSYALVIANNTIGSITVNGSSTGVSASLTGIQVTAGTNTIGNNTVGSTVTANSLNAATSSTSATGQQVTGIAVITSSTSASITGNTVANLNNNYAGTGTGGQIRGIVTSFGVNSITGNTVRNLSTTSQNADNTASQSVVGISAASAATTAPQTVSQNTVHSLVNAAASAGVSVTGIYFVGPTFGANVVARVAQNLVHSLAVSSSSASSVVKGMEFGAGVFAAQNNMVRVGFKADGTGTAGASVVRAIYDNGTTSGRNFYHNSVYLGGTQTSGTGGTRAFESSASGSGRAVQNNIFVNARNNSGATGKHYAVYYGSADTYYLKAGGNLFLASGTGGVLGNYFGDRTTLAAWQAATGQDATSAVADPLFIAPTGTAATVDLHLQASNPAEGGGIALIDAATGASATVTDDFDGQTRSALTPTDIGADAGAFTRSSDVFAPVISYPLLTSGSTASRVLTGWATITDNAGVAGGATAPRLYFKKSTDADVFGVANNSTGNGWKYVIATGSGPYSFTMDYSLLYKSGGGGGSVTAGNTIQYFVVAQDAANNFRSSPAGVTVLANPPVQNVNGYGAVNSFSIVGSTFTGTVTVGGGGTYPSLSGAGGLFAALNGPVLTGNVTVSLTSDLTEDGSVTLGQLNSDNYPQPTVTIQPGSATMRTISGNVDTSIITLDGADRVIIDGRFGGSGRYLTFRNTNTYAGASTLLFINDACSNTVRNCVVEGAGGTVIDFGTGPVTGNDNNLITGCQVRDLSTAAGMPQFLIGSDGISAALANSGNVISNNELFNFKNDGIRITSDGNESWTISGNEIYEVNAAIVGSAGISMQGGGTNLITGNFIHDIVTAGSESYCIYFGGTGTTTISRNRITAFNLNAATSTVYGILSQGSVGSTLNVVDNQITLSLAASANTSFYGIVDRGSADSVFNAFFNSIVIGGTESGIGSSWASLRNRATTHTARDNLFLNLRTGGANPGHYAVGSEAAGGSYAVGNNVYAGTGSPAAYFMDFSNQGYGPETFAQWQSSTGDTTSQAGIAGSGSFTAAMFMNAAAGDLHLVPGGNVLVNALGTPIAGVTDDYDGDLRNPITPSIGSDEFPVPDITVEQPVGNGLTDGVSLKDFGTATVNSGTVVAIFKITNTGSAALNGLAVTLTPGTANAGEFGTTQPASTTLAPGTSTFFNVSFTPGATGTRSAAIHIASNVTGTKNPFDIALTGTGQTAFQAWAATNGTSGRWIGDTTSPASWATTARPTVPCRWM
jgi:hypothetical protein